MIWRTVFENGKTAYQVNRITGRRRAYQYPGGYQPVATNWIKDGVWPIATNPPTGGTSGQNR